MANKAPQTPASEETGQLARELAYISEREQSLSRYSDRLRQAVEKVADAFGDDGFCRVCGEHADNHSQRSPGHSFEKRIEVSLELDDTEAFADGETGQLRLHLGKHLYARRWFDDEPTDKFWALENIKRESLKALVRSGRLTAFIRYIAKTLQEQSQEYQEVAELAEKMAQAISS